MCLTPGGSNPLFSEYNSKNNKWTGQGKITILIINSELPIFIMDRPL